VVNLARYAVNFTSTTTVDRRSYTARDANPIESRHASNTNPIVLDDKNIRSEMCSEKKKTLRSWMQKIQKKKELFSVRSYSKAGGEKSAKIVFIAHARTWSSTTRPRPTSRDSVVRIIPVVCFRRIIFAHVCMCVVRIQKETFFWSIFRQKIVKNSSACDERKNEQSFPRPLSRPRGKNNKKRNDVSLLFSPQSRKPRAR
jgi:hypothetical protein